MTFGNKALSCFLGSFLLATTVYLAGANAQNQRFMYEGHEVSKEYFDALNIAVTATPLLRAGKFAEAREILEKVVPVLTDNGAIMGNYAMVLARLGKPAEALPFYEKSIQLDPASESNMIGYAGALVAMGDNAKSVEVGKEFLKKFPKSAMYTQMKNQVATLERELKKSGVPSTQANSQGGNDYFSEATTGIQRRWYLKRLPVYITDGSVVDRYKPEFAQMMHRAFDEWMTRGQDVVHFDFVDDPKNAKIICEWSANPKKLRNPAEQGQTDTTYSNNGQMMKATIIMLTFTSTNPDVVLSDAKFMHTALHEVGHALGIHGHSNNPRDIMYFASVDDAPAALSARDLNTFWRLYGYVPSSAESSSTPANANTNTEAPVNSGADNPSASSN